MMLRIVLACLALCALYACNPGPAKQPAFDQSAAEGVAQRFYRFQKTGELDSIEAMFSKSYRDASSRQQRQAYLATVNERFGTVKEVTIESWQSVQGLRSATYELVYQVIRSKRIARETLDLVADDGSLRISGYRLDSDGMQLSDSLLTSNGAAEL